jgi:hypothetical protein
MEIEMRLLGKTALIVGMAGAMALGSMTASQARWRGAGPAAGFVAGAAIGAAAAGANAGYYGPGYGYDSYAYEPGYSYDGPATAYTGDPSYSYGGYGYSNYGYNRNYTGSLRERQLEGRDY